MTQVQSSEQESTRTQHSEINAINAASPAAMECEAPDTEWYPRESEVTLRAANNTNQQVLGSTQNYVSRKEREAFVQSKLSPRVQALLNQPFGKENLTQCFKSAAALRLALLPLLRSEFMSLQEWDALRIAYPIAGLLLDLVRDHEDVDFRPIRGLCHRNPDMDNKPIDDTWVQMATAAILHFDGDMAALVRWMGGTHVGAHRDTQKILNTINGIVDDGTFGHVRRLYTQGAPAFCNAESSEANFQAYLKYGNHSSVYDDVEKTRKTLTKVLNRGYCMLLDKRMVYFTLNCHVTPQGLIDLHHKTKDPRPIFDSSFRPHPWCYAINDWTSKTTEPPITFPEAWTTYLQWLYNLRISYPDREIYPGDDDVSGAYRHMKYHPNLVAMHTFMPLNYMAVATGATFGDCTSPSNWDPIAQARQQMARHLWKHPNIIHRAAPYMPNISLSSAPGKDIQNDFVKADADAKNCGVFHVNGTRMPPPYAHHVDDNMYADVAEHLTRTISASIVSLYEVLGYPSETAPSDIISPYGERAKKILV
jgi:hypothetical protein